MGQCQPINGLVLSVEGEQAIRDIQKVVAKAKRIQLVLTAGALVVSVFNGKALVNAFNVTTNDWVLLAKGVQGLPDVLRHEIQFIVFDQLTRAGGDANEQIFWKEFADNCIFD